MSTPIFPQAYTVDTVAKAFEWLQGQPQLQSSVKSTDQLVNLFLKAKRMGASAKEAATADAFKSDLKNLAQSLRSFEDETPQPTQQQMIAQSIQSQLAQTFNTPPPPPQANHHIPIPQTMAPPPPAPASIPQPRPQVAVPQGLDAKTQAILHDVQTSLNLSSTTEAMRVLITLGYERIKVVFPN